jgi:hypothetical protein
MPFRHRKKHDSGPDLFDSTPSYKAEVEEFITEWNSRVWLPKLTRTDRQCKEIRLAMQRPFFKTHWREAFKILARSRWLVLNMKPRFRLDWFLEPDNFDKVIEEFYVDQPTQNNSVHRAKRTGDDEEIL